MSYGSPRYRIAFALVGLLLFLIGLGTFSGFCFVGGALLGHAAAAIETSRERTRRLDERQRHHDAKTRADEAKARYRATRV